MPAWYSADSAWRRCSPHGSVHSPFGLVRLGFGMDRLRRSTASSQIVASGANTLMFEQTSSSNSRGTWHSVSGRSRLDSSAGIRSAAAILSAGLPEGTRLRCSSMSSRIVTASPTHGIQRNFQNWLENGGALPKIFGRLRASASGADKPPLCSDHLLSYHKRIRTGRGVH
jgi:hypothetical protein